MTKPDFRNTVNSFSIAGEFLSAIPTGSGHINDTYRVVTTQNVYILQRLNSSIFKDVNRMNQNIIMALGHFYSKQRASNDIRFTEIELVICLDGNSYYKDDNGSCWRMMNYVPNSISFDVAHKPDIAYEGASAYGYFQKNIIDLNPDDFFPVIKDFHNLEMRLNHFNDILEKDPLNRNQSAVREIEFVQSHFDLSYRLKKLLESGEIPLRVTHNDTKINNILLDKDTHKGIAVIDLDTIMPGTVLFDFGDMIRTFTSPADEDETDLSKVTLRIEIFEAMVKGYLSELKEVITKPEINNLVFGGKIMTFMIGLRFLTDFLEGDVYFKTSRENHNLDRCRTQFKLLLDIENLEAELEGIIQKYSS